MVLIRLGELCRLRASGPTNAAASDAVHVVSGPRLTAIAASQLGARAIEVADLSASLSACSAIRLPAKSLMRAARAGGDRLRVERPAGLDVAGRRTAARAASVTIEVAVRRERGGAQVLLHGAGVLVDEGQVERERAHRPTSRAPSPRLRG